MPKLNELNSAEAYGATGVTPTVEEGEPAPRPCKLTFLPFNDNFKANLICNVYF
jgi:hypothetical protein